MKPYHKGPRVRPRSQGLRPFRPFFVLGRERPPVLTRPTSPAVFRPPLAVDPESGEIGWSHTCIEEELEDLGLL